MKYRELKNKLFKRFGFLVYISGLKHPVKNIKRTIQIKRKFNDYQCFDGELPIEKIEVFKKSFIRLLWAQDKDWKLPFLFLEAKITCEKESFKREEINDNSPILICPIKDDIERLKISLEHYRKMGIQYFVYLDNMSTDGTYEYLKQQNDVNLYSCKTSYTTLNREAWINRILSYYGFEQWYLCVDSDELFVYTDMEKITIQEYVKKINIQKQRRIKSILLDMYSKEPIFNKEITDNKIKQYYCYFDKDTYCENHTYKLDIIKGGPRKRVFFKDSNSNTLTKYPLFFLKEGDIQCCSHFQFPFSQNCDKMCTTALLHYKFLSSDLKKYVERAKVGNYANGSIEYKKYIEAYQKGEDIILYDDKHSTQYKNSFSIQQIKL